MLHIKEIKETHRLWVKKISIKHYGGKFCVFLGRKFFLDKLPGFFVENENNKKLGLITYEIKRNCLEIISLNAFQKFQGIGSLLVKKVIKIAKNKKLKKIKVVTTNDNIDALRFYQKKGFEISKLYKNALKKDRILKPSIPKIGDYGIPIKDAIELQMRL